MRKNKNKGFTLVEMLVAVAIVAIMATLSIATMNSISSTRMKKSAETFKSTIEVARDYAMTHGGNTYVSIVKTTNGLQIVETTTAERDMQGNRVDRNISETNIDDKGIVLYYKLAGDNTEYQLGAKDADAIGNNMIQMEFSALGAFIGSYIVDQVRLTNGSKEYTFLFEAKTGYIFYDYEYEGPEIKNLVGAATSKIIELPTFAVSGKNYTTVTVKYTGEIVQPQLAYDSRYATISGAYRAKDVGEYKIVFSLKDPYTTKWADGGVYDYVLTWKIVESD